MLKVLQLTSSRFFGGPERQMLELARELQDRVEMHFATFREDGLAQAFVNEVSEFGFSARLLEHDTPHLRAALRELTSLLQKTQTDLLCCHGYKANLLGRMAARKSGIPVLGVSRGWTAESFRVRAYEALDRFALKHLDHVICVSHAQAKRVQAAKVPAEKISVIHNAVRLERFADTEHYDRRELLSMFDREVSSSVISGRVNTVIGAGGRLSPEKGFEVLIRAASRVCQLHSDVGFIIFGEGPCRKSLEEEVANCGLQDRVLLPGFCRELDRWIPHFDLNVLSSYTEGLPNILLESLAAGVPVVATDVGGNRELVQPGRGGRLVASGDVPGLASAIEEMLTTPALLVQEGQAGRDLVAREFSFSRQAERYCQLFTRLTGVSCELPQPMLAKCSLKVS